ncbi:MalY/PatB family protein [Heyndrickxia sp. NPDC080065]|uniref:MalY/PatB family protein n=1 Tax=Heyndrickxia sp. NPDC080065 TaxID=3390568 RepID=UPI003D08CB1E
MTLFDQVIERKGTSSVKWDYMKFVYGEDELLPMWVADMDFRPPEAVIQALQERLNHGIFGYTVIPDSTGEAIQNWLKSRHGWNIDRSWLLYNHGVVPSLGLAILAFTDPGDNILLQSPVYTPFFTMTENNNRNVINCPLQLVNNRFEIDFIQLEEALQNNIKLFFLCNPHNPGGRVWKREELIKIAELCKKYNVLIISDEIHGDLVGAPQKHIPIASLDESYRDFVVTCIAPTKTFNLAGIQASSLIVPNPDLREKLVKIQEQQGFHTLNAFGIVGMEAAYRYGEEWLDTLLPYIKDNIQLVKETINQEVPAIKVMEPEGGYLIWLDCRDTGYSDVELKNRLLKIGRLALEPGTKYGLGGEGFLRMNVGCPRETIQEGVIRLIKALS